jgi:hypothetical protein
MPAQLLGNPELRCSAVLLLHGPGTAQPSWAGGCVVGWGWQGPAQEV